MNGNISKSKILEQQPAMEEPLVKGIPYLTVRWQLVVAGPRLMEMLSRTGKASHGVARVETTLQSCARLHQLALEHTDVKGSVNWEVVVSQASLGRDPDYPKIARLLSEFERAWPGGKHRPDLEGFGTLRTHVESEKINPGQ